MYRVFLKFNETTVGVYSVHTEASLCVNMGLWMPHFLSMACLKRGTLSRCSGHICT